MGGMCVACHQPAGGALCPTCQRPTAARLLDLLRYHNELRTLIVPGTTAADASGRRSPGGKVHSPAPANIDALNLLAGGAADVPAILHPQLRRWSSTENVTVHTTVGARARVHTVAVTTWHTEPVLDTAGRPVLISNDDQIGVIPPREWLDAQVRTWRRVLHHPVPARTITTTPLPPRPDTGPDFAALAARSPAAGRVIAALATVDAAYRTGRAALAVGVHDQLPAWLRPDDALHTEWEQRFGRHTDPNRSMSWDVRYLISCLDTAAADPGIDVARFVTELASVTAEIRRVLGHPPNQDWIGRCPAWLVEHTRTCGAGLWLDVTDPPTPPGRRPTGRDVRCPRCATEWPASMVGLTQLAVAIRKAWPVDRRRRYTAAQARTTHRPTCPGCGGRVTIEWRNVTVPTDREQWWQATDAACPHGCPAARRTL